MSIFASAKTANGVAGLRDVTPADLQAIVNYWLLSPDEHLVFMGVDQGIF